MSFKKSLLLVIPLLVTSCGTIEHVATGGHDTLVISYSDSNNEESTSSENKTTTSSSLTSSSVETSLTSSKPATVTPYSYEADSFMLPTPYNGDHLRTYDITANDPFKFGIQENRLSLFEYDWVKNKNSTIAYSGEDDKPVIRINSLMINDYTVIGDNMNITTNLDLPLDHYKASIGRRFELEKYLGNTILLYDCEITASCYRSSYGDYETEKKEYTQHLNGDFILDVNEAYQSNNEKDFLRIFSYYGTHVAWATEYGRSICLSYYLTSKKRNMNEVDGTALKNELDSTLMSGIESKTYEEYETKANFSLYKYLGVNEEDIDAEIKNASTTGLPFASVPIGIDFSPYPNLVTKLGKGTSVESATRIRQVESYPIWEFLPESMLEQKECLKAVYPKYIEKQAQHYQQVIDDYVSLFLQ